MLSMKQRKKSLKKLLMSTKQGKRLWEKIKRIDRKNLLQTCRNNLTGKLRKRLVWKRSKAKHVKWKGRKRFVEARVASEPFRPPKGSSTFGGRSNWLIGDSSCYNWLTDWPIHGPTDRATGRSTNRPALRPADQKTDRVTDRPTHWPTEKKRPSRLQMYFLPKGMLDKSTAYGRTGERTNWQALFYEVALSRL